MKLPRDVDGPKLANALHVLGYRITRQKGSHIRITTQQEIPCHSPIKAGTLSSILKRIAAHHSLAVDELLKLLDF